MMEQEYAKALLSLTEEEGNTESVLESCREIASIFSENPEYLSMLDNPAMAKPERVALLDQSFHSVEPMLLNLLKILCEKRELLFFPAIVKEYRKLYEVSRNITNAVAVTAKPLSEQQMSALKAKLESLTGKTVLLTNEIDPSVLGGITLRYEGKQLDGSLRARLDSFRNGLKQSIV